jgi:hypothetical protein
MAEVDVNPLFGAELKVGTCSQFEMRNQFLTRSGLSRMRLNQLTPGYAAPALPASFFHPVFCYPSILSLGDPY